MQYYGVIRNANYLEHHGVLGMKWGVRRYQNKDGTRTAAGKKLAKSKSGGKKRRPFMTKQELVDALKVSAVGALAGPGAAIGYSNMLDANRERAERQAKSVEKLSKVVDSFEYGTIIKGKRYGEEELGSVDWSKYRTLPISTVAKEKIGNCWDFVNYQHAMLDKASVPNSNYMFVMDRGRGPDDIVTHTFTIAQCGKQSKWIESAMWSKHGVHDVRGPADVAKELVSVYGKHSYDLYQYNPDGMDQGLTDQEYFARATSGDPILQRKIK